MSEHLNYGQGPTIANAEQMGLGRVDIKKVETIPELTPWYKTNGITAGTLRKDPLTGKMMKENYFGDDSVAGLNDFVSANDYDGAVTSGYKGTESDFGKLQAADAKGTGWGMSGYGGVALGAGQLGLGLMSYLENKETAGKQRALLDQQIKQNKYVLENAQNRANSIRAGFASGFSSRPQGA